MKSARQILREMAFNPKAPESTKQALLNSIQKALQESQKAEVIPVESHKLKKGDQLSFNLEGPKKKSRA